MNPYADMSMVEPQLLPATSDVIHASGNLHINRNVVGEMLGSTINRQQIAKKANWLDFEDFKFKIAHKYKSQSDLTKEFSALAKLTGIPILYASSHFKVLYSIVYELGIYTPMQRKSKVFHLDVIPDQYCKGNGLTDQEIAFWKYAQQDLFFPLTYGGCDAATPQLQVKNQYEFRAFLPNGKTKAYTFLSKTETLVGFTEKGPCKKEFFRDFSFRYTDTPHDVVRAKFFNFFESIFKFT